MQALQKIGGTILLVVFLSLVYYFSMPTLAYGFFGVPFAIILAGIIALIINIYLGGAMFILGVIGLVIMPILTSWGFMYSTEYRKLIGNVEESVFSQDVTAIDISQMRIVDQDVAKRVGEKKLGEDPALGSRAQIGTFNIQQVRGQLYWVAPVEHSGFWKWKSFGTTPGYVMVSATNERDVKYITQIGGEKIELRYQPQSFFGDNLERHLYMNGFSSVGLTDYTFEIDEEGNPFWVVTKFEKKVGYSGENATGVVVVNPQTGEINEYSIADAPVWIDRIQPEDIITSQINSWGAYVNGWLNQSLFGAQNGVLQATPGMSLVYGHDGKSYWYTGISSSGTDGSTVGFILVNTRTKETHRYNQAGATETQAQGSARGKVQEKGFNASFPILYNISGIPTYVMALKDDAGLIKMIAMVSVEDYGIVGVGNSTGDALRSYRSELASKGNAIAPDGAVESQQHTGIIARFATDIRDGQTFYYLTINELPNKLFIAASGISSEIPITLVGDSVKIEYQDGGSGVTDLSRFDNLTISLSSTDAQAEVDARFDRAESEQEVSRDAQSAERQFDELSDEEKAKVLQLLQKSE